MMSWAATAPMPGISSSWATWAASGADGLADPGGEGIDLGGERVDPGQHHAQHEGVVIGEVPGERLLQDAGLGAHVPVGQGG
jgi:hypothetical protein